MTLGGDARATEQRVGDAEEELERLRFLCRLDHKAEAALHKTRRLGQGFSSPSASEASKAAAALFRIMSLEAFARTQWNTATK